MRSFKINVYSHDKKEQSVFLKYRSVYTLKNVIVNISLRLLFSYKSFPQSDKKPLINSLRHEIYMNYT